MSPASRFRPIRRIRRQGSGELPLSVSTSVECLPTHCQTNSSPFRGTLTSQLKCTQCGFKVLPNFSCAFGVIVLMFDKVFFILHLFQSALRFDKFDTLSLPLPTPARMQRLKLQSLLDNFVSTEIVKDVTCSNCSKGQDKTVQTTALKTLNFGKV